MSKPGDVNEADPHYEREPKPPETVSLEEYEAVCAERDNLLARIFRDGGQRAAELGTRAVQEADSVVANMIVERDELRAALERVIGFIDDLALLGGMTTNDTAQAALDAAREALKR